MVSESYIAELINNLHKNSKLLQVIVTSSEIEAQKIFELSKKMSHNFLYESDFIYVPGYFQTGVYRYESSKKIIAKRLSSAHQMTQKFPRVFIC